MIWNYYCQGISVARFNIHSDEQIFTSAKDMSDMKWTDWKQGLLLDCLDKIPGQILPVQTILKNLKRKETFLLPCYEKTERQDSSSICLWMERSDMIRDEKQTIDYYTKDDQLIAAVGLFAKRMDVLVLEGVEEELPFSWIRNTDSAPVYGFQKPIHEKVRMRDGIALATDVYLLRETEKNAKKEKWPVVLIRTCYGKNDCRYDLYFVAFGYAVVIQDTRGREESEGEWEPIVNEARDGKDTLDWVSCQTWCDGNIGMIGASYLAIVQWAAAMSGHPNLKAMISQVTGGTPTFDFPFRNGVMESGTLAWLFSMSRRKFEPSLMERDDWDDVLDHRPISDIPTYALGHSIHCWEQWMEHPCMDDYWKQADWTACADKIDIPTLYISGWYDDVGAGTSQAWRMNALEHRKHQKMILGPWKHGFNTTRTLHGIFMGEKAVSYSLQSEYIRWFDRYLKGITPKETENTVFYYQVNDNEWKQSKTWPPEEGKITGVYLDDGQKLSLCKPAGTGEDSYRFDPSDPAPHLIDMSENECLVPENYKDMEQRDDVLIYTSQPLREDLKIAGELECILYASTDCRDTDWVVRLTDVDEEGNSIRMSDGLVRARFRSTFEKEELLRGGEVVCYFIPMSWIACTVKAGHCLRVEVTSGAKNCIFPNPNTGNPMAEDVEHKIARQTIYYGKDFPSHVNLPLII